MKTKIPRNINKAFAIASCMGSALKSLEKKPEYYTRLGRQIDKAMKVYAMKVGKKHYHSISKEIQIIWGEMLDKNSHVIQQDAMIELVNAFATLISAKDFKDFLSIHQPVLGESVLSEPDDFRKICLSVTSLDVKINKVLGTKPVVMMKPREKIKKVKKERTKSKKISEHEKQVIKDKLFKLRKEEFFKEIREKAKKAKEKENENNHTNNTDTN